MQTDFQSSAWLAFQNFLLLLPCTSWFLRFSCVIVCVEIFPINLKSYLKSITNSLVCRLFNKISREKQIKLIFKERNKFYFLSHLFISFYMLLRSVSFHTGTLCDIISVLILHCYFFPLIKRERFFLWDYNNPYESMITRKWCNEN